MFLAMVALIFGSHFGTFVSGSKIPFPGIARVKVQPEQLIIQLAEAQGSDRQKAGSNAALEVSWQKTISRRRRAIVVPDGMSPQHARPLRSENRATLVASIARGRRWLDELIAEQTATTDSIAKRERCSVRKANMTISLAFLAPDHNKIDWPELSHLIGGSKLARRSLTLHAKSIAGSCLIKLSTLRDTQALQGLPVAFQFPLCPTCWRP